MIVRVLLQGGWEVGDETNHHKYFKYIFIYRDSLIVYSVKAKQVSLL